MKKYTQKLNKNAPEYAKHTESRKILFVIKNYKKENIEDSSENRKQGLHKCINMCIIMRSKIAELILSADFSGNSTDFGL